MSRKQSKIRTKSYMRLAPDGDAKVSLCDLSSSQKDYIGALLHTKFLNSLYAGKVQFWTEDIPDIEDVLSTI